MPAQGMANNCMNFDIMAKHGSEKRKKKNVTLLSVMAKEFENRFQDCQKNTDFLLFLQLHFHSTVHS